ncbi:MAG: DUF3322 domain-containing protein [Ramlibacter sp.]
MSWTSPADLKAQLARLWERGELLRPLVTAEVAFPRRLSLKGPSSADLGERFEAVRGWSGQIAAMPHLRIEWREVRHRIQGRQRLPAAVWIDSLEDACALLSKRRDAARMAELVEFTRGAVPQLSPWLARRPLQALELADRWPRLLAVVVWMREHPRPGIYLRQVDVPGVDSKFIEQHREVLSELLDLALAPEAVEVQRVGINQFAARYGFLEKPARIRFRVLDERVALLRGAALPDVALDASSFASLGLPVRRVFITENETNFLAFPPAGDAIVIFGSGYGWDALARAQWLASCDLYYWGDIDTHGFAILDQLRSRFERVASLLMDRDTLMAHQALWGEEPDQVLHDLSRLTRPERALFDDLRDNRIRRNLRLEQERVGFERVAAAVRRLAAGAD